MADLPHEAGRSRIGLALNRQGWDRAVASGCDEANVVVCATDGFGIRNQGASVDEQIAALADIVEARETSGGPPISLTVSVAFGCPFEGEVPEAAVSPDRRRRRGSSACPRSPWPTPSAWPIRPPCAGGLRLAREAAPDATLRVHFHDTRGTALANAWAAIEEGVRVLDASCGGLGGCPFAPGATGNVATEDLVWMLHRAGFETGLDVGGHDRGRALDRRADRQAADLRAQPRPAFPAGMNPRPSWPGGGELLAPP